MHTPTMLVILDGFGYNKNKDGNAIAQAHMPFWNSLLSNYPSALLKASGESVGLLPGFIGNSEVGHLTLGAGRIVPSMLKRFSDAINDGTLATSPVLLDNFATLKASGKSLHLMGLVSDAGVHSYLEHAKALIKMACQYGIKQVFIHAFLDGRDVPPMSAFKYLEDLQQFCIELQCGFIASIHGRFYAMDRDENWQRTCTSYEAMCGLGTQSPIAIPWQEGLKQAYDHGETDEFVHPLLLTEHGAIKPGDGVIFFNFRPDRARQLTKVFLDPNFQHFNNPINTGNGTLSFFISATRYKESFTNPVLFEPELVKDTLLDVIGTQPQPQPVFIIAETEKFAHVTYFFRGMEEKQLANETRTLIPSIKAQNYIQHPEMSAPGITAALIRSLRTNPAFFYLVNYANADMVGHSGNLAATIKACEVLDQQLALLYHEVVKRLHGLLVITADHGNAEEKLDAAGNGLTAHTTNPVPFVYISGKPKKMTEILVDRGFGLANVAPTLLKHMMLKIPDCMNNQTIF